MLFDLHEIINAPGREAAFQCELDRERISFPSLETFRGPVTARGQVKNTGGTLKLSADVRADMTVRCARCARPVDILLTPHFTAALREDAENEDSENVFPITGNCVDVSDVLETLFILTLDMRFLCREDCRGLCPVCGKCLNDGPCSCKQPIDPRMAVLGRLLDDIQEV